MKNKELYREVFSQVHTSVQITLEDFQMTKKQRAPTRVLAVLAASAALLTAFIACAFSLWRCPHCGQLLGWNLAWSLGRGISFCPYCHQRLD